LILKFTLILPLLTLLLLGSSLIFAQDNEEIEYVEVEIDFSMDIPEELSEYDESWIKVKYGGENAPDIVYGNEIGSVTIGISFYVEPLDKSDLSEFAYASKMELVASGVEWISSNREFINGRSTELLRFYSESTDGPTIYNIIAFFIFDGELVIVTFNCLKSDELEWRESLDAIVHTIEIG